MNEGVQITITLAGLVVFIREAAWFVRTLRGQTPTSDMKELFHELTQTLKEMNVKIDDTKHIAERVHDKVCDLRDRL